MTAPLAPITVPHDRSPIALDPSRLVSPEFSLPRTSPQNCSRDVKKVAHGVSDEGFSEGCRSPKITLQMVLHYIAKGFEETVIPCLERPTLSLWMSCMSHALQMNLIQLSAHPARLAYHTIVLIVPLPLPQVGLEAARDSLGMGMIHPSACYGNCCVVC